MSRRTCANCETSKAFGRSDSKLLSKLKIRMSAFWRTRRICTRAGGSYIVNEKHHCSGWSPPQPEKSA